MSAEIPGAAIRQSVWMRQVWKFSPWLLMAVGLVFLFAWPDPVALEPSQAESPFGQSMATVDLVRSPKLVGACLVVIAILAVLPSILKRVHQPIAGRQRMIEVLDVHPISRRRSLILARVGNRQVLIGSSESGLTSLETMPESAVKQATGGESTEQPHPFPAVLHALQRQAP